jgi:hypothetical protein
MKHKYPEAATHLPTGTITYAAETSQPLPKSYHTQQRAQMSSIAYVYSGPYITAVIDRNIGGEFGDGPLGLDQWYECEPGVWIPNWHNLCVSLGGVQTRCGFSGSEIHEEKYPEDAARKKAEWLEYFQSLSKEPCYLKTGLVIFYR